MEGSFGKARSRDKAVRCARVLVLVLVVEVHPKRRYGVDNLIRENKSGRFLSMEKIS
jgi:hypothetical protein